MKITKQQLQQMVKEEVQKEVFGSLKEDSDAKLPTAEELGYLNQHLVNVATGRGGALSGDLKKVLVMLVRILQDPQVRNALK